jgi:hypothetical protein
MAVDELAQAIIDNPNQGELLCYLCGDEIATLGNKLAFFPTETGFELCHKKCIDALKREAKRKRNG